MSKSTTSHDVWLRDQLTNDDEFMVAYLQVAFEECESVEEILLALRSAVEARGISTIAEKIGIARESLSRALSPKGNPTLKTLYSLLLSIGVKFTVSPLVMREAENSVRQFKIVTAMQPESAAFALLAIKTPYSGGTVTFAVIANNFPDATHGGVSVQSGTLR